MISWLPLNPHEARNRVRSQEAYGGTAFQIGYPTTGTNRGTEFARNKGRDKPNCLPTHTRGTGEPRFIQATYHSPRNEEPSSLETRASNAVYPNQTFEIGTFGIGRPHAPDLWKSRTRLQLYRRSIIRRQEEPHTLVSQAPKVGAFRAICATPGFNLPR